MKAMARSGARRGRFHGSRQIVLYNWPSYVRGILACLSALTLAALAARTPFARLALDVAGAAAGFWLVSSLLASYWVYDHSVLCQWDWIADLFPIAPSRWATMHVGLDETTLKLRELFPGTASTVLDLYDPNEMTEPSIRRARQLTPSPVPALHADASSLLFGDAELDAVFLIFAAHEIRRSDRRLRLFRELRRVLKPGGRVLIVEHLRDLPIFLVFGPGFLHFHARREWLRLAREAGLAVAREFRITPFVAVFLLESPQ